ncbi:E3 ubiquitin-protein ligase RNF8 [Pelodytes ibericus]
MAEAGPGLTWSLRRRGGDHESLILRDGEEITVGRGIGVTYQLTSTLCPLMVSRVHCTLRQNSDGQWTITDNQSLNGVWVNKSRIESRKAHILSQGSCIQLGVPLPNMDKAEFEYEVTKEPLDQTCPQPSRTYSGKSRSSKTKRKFNSEDSEASGTEGPSHISKAKVHRVSRDSEEPTKSSSCKSDLSRQRTVRAETTAPPDQCQVSSSIDTDDLAPTQQQCRGTLQLTKVRQTMTQIRRLNGHMQEKQLEMQEKLSAPQQSKSIQSTDVLLVQKELHELQNQLSSERERHLHLVQELKQIYQEKQQKQGERILAEEGHLMEQLAQALQEHTLLMEELNRIQAINRELQETKEEREKVRAQKEEVLNHMNDVLDNELQCIICSEHFIKAVTLNCAHSFCSFCIKEWRKRKDECPICRQDIRSQTRSLVLDNCIDRMVDKLSPEMKDRRVALILERKEVNQTVEVIPDDSMSDSSSLQSDTFFISSTSDSEDMEDEFGNEFWDLVSEVEDEDDFFN